jgi:hypothetical protein
LACVSSRHDNSGFLADSSSGTQATYYGRWVGYDCEHGGSVFQPADSEEFIFIEDKIDEFAGFLRIDPDGGCEAACLEVALVAQRIGPGQFGAFGFAKYKLVAIEVLSVQTSSRSPFNCLDGI